MNEKESDPKICRGATLVNSVGSSGIVLGLCRWLDPLFNKLLAFIDEIGHSVFGVIGKVVHAFAGVMQIVFDLSTGSSACLWRHQES